MSEIQGSSKELVCAVCAEPWALGHRCKPTPIPAAGQCGKRCGFDIKTGRLATIDPECHVHGGPQPTASNQMAIEVREAFAESARMAHGTGHYDDCWKDHWPCVLERLLSEIGRLQRELEGRHTLDCDLAKHRNCTRCSCKSESLSGGNPGEKSVSRPADHRGIVAARSSEGGIVGQNPGETIQSCELVDSNPVPVGRASPEQLHAKDVDPSPSIAAHEPLIEPAAEQSAANSGPCVSREAAQSGTTAGSSLPPANEPAVEDGDHLERFTAYVVKEIPPGTIISNPQWWAKRLLAAAIVTAPEAPALPPAVTPAAIHAMCAYIRDKACSGCKGSIDTPYGSGTPGCFAIARWHIETALRVTSTKQPQPPSANAHKPTLCNGDATKDCSDHDDFNYCWNCKTTREQRSALTKEGE